VAAEEPGAGVTESHPRFGSAGHYWSWLCFTRSKTRTSCGGRRCGCGYGRKGRRSRVRLHPACGHQHPERSRRSGMDTRRRPLGAPSRTRSPRWRSHSQPDLEAPRTALLSCPSSSLQTPTKDQDHPDPLTKTGTLQTQPRTRIQANSGTRRSTRELVHAYLVC
jgi:hypothetical protein